MSGGHRIRRAAAFAGLASGVAFFGGQSFSASASPVIIAPEASSEVSNTEVNRIGASSIVAPDFAAGTFDPNFAWTTFVANHGGQDAVDACQGGLTDMTAEADLEGSYLGYFPIHNHCGGEPILTLQVGDEVFISGYGAFTVIDYREVEQGDTTRALSGLGGDILLQTCHETGLGMRVVALDMSW